MSDGDGRDDSVKGDELLARPNSRKGVKRMSDKVMIRVDRKMVEEMVRKIVREKRGCECEPDPEAVKKVALQEGLDTDRVLRICSAIAKAAKGQFP